MICDWDRCWREPTIAIPLVGQWCSAHAIVAVGTWPTRRYREIESENSRRFLSSEAAA